MLSRAQVCFRNGYVLEFQPSNGEPSFPPRELLRLNDFAKQRCGVLNVFVEERQPIRTGPIGTSPLPQLHRRTSASAPALKKPQAYRRTSARQ